MTSIAFVVGLIPMMDTKSPSAQGNHSISIGFAEKARLEADVNLYRSLGGG